MTESRNRQSMRLLGYDYTQAGGYFVTIFTQGWVHLFGQVKDDEMLTNDLGRIVQRTWLGLPDHFAGIELDDFIIIPNHLHGIVIINYVADHVRAHVRAPLQEMSESQQSHRHLHRNPGSLGSIISGFKFSATRQINIYRGTPSAPVWLRGYYDRIIRDEK